jgi:diphthamide biosynthesis protein 2
MPFKTNSFTDSLTQLLERLGGENVIILSENDTLLNKLDDFPVEKQILHLDDFAEETPSKVEKVIYIGESKSPKLTAWCLQNQPDEVFVIFPTDGKISENPVDLGRLLMQRFHLIEKGKDAERVGLLLGSNGAHELSVKCMDKLRELGQNCGKSVYTVVVGEPTPQKLANLPEMDVFVLIGSPEVSILPAKGFYKPVLHPFEFMMACTGKDWTGKFCVNWALFLDDNVEVTLKGFSEQGSFLAVGSFLAPATV